MTDRPAQLPFSELLVSVRSADEAEAALAGGAGLIDIKEPSAGALGKASDQTIAAVVDQVARRCPVSAALGELTDWATGSVPRLDPGVSLVKIGLSAAGRIPWREQLESLRLGIESHNTARLAFAAYADWRRAEAPRLQDVAEFALLQRPAAFLVDTWLKDGSSLLDWISVQELMELCNQFRHARIAVALAGSLGRKQIRQLRLVRPTFFAVRGAACVGGRDGTMTTDLVRDLVAELKLQQTSEDER